MKKHIKENDLPLKMSQNIFGSFLRVSAIHSDLLDWKIDNLTITLTKTLLSILDIDVDAKNLATNTDYIKYLMKQQDTQILFATNQKLNRAVSV